MGLSSLAMELDSLPLSYTLSEAGNKDPAGQTTAIVAYQEHLDPLLHNLNTDDDVWTVTNTWEKHTYLTFESPLISEDVSQ